MPVEIQILSGPRRGEQLGFEHTQFSAGTAPQCDIYFDPAQHEPSRGRSALFLLTDEGWIIRSTGNGQLRVNQQLVSGPTHLRSGDVIRFSDAGPDLSFNIVSQLSSKKVIGLQCGDKPVAVVGERSPLEKQRSKYVATGTWLVATCCLLGGLGITLVRLSQHKVEPERAGIDEPVAENLQIARAPREPVATTRASKSGQSSKSSEGDRPRLKADATDVVSNPANRSAEIEGQETSADGNSNLRPSERSWATVLDKYKKAVLLVTIEDPKGTRSWPFGTAAAVDHKVLLTSATVASELAKFQKSGWKVWASSQETGVKHPIEEARIHVGFLKSAGDPSTQIYFNLALLKVSSPVAVTIPLASESTLEQLDSGAPVSVCGVPHEGEAISRFQSFPPGIWPTKRLVVTALPPSPGGPRLLHLKGELPKHLFGAPIISEDGELVAVYGDKAGTDPERKLPWEIHYCTVVQKDLIDEWFQKHNEGVWVLPVGTELSGSATP